MVANQQVEKISSAICRRNVKTARGYFDALERTLQDVDAQSLTDKQLSVYNEVGSLIDQLNKKLDHLSNTFR